VIVAISRLTQDDRYKGVELLIQAMPEVLKAEPQATLRIIGQGDDLPRLRSLARGLGLLGQGIELLGFVKDEELRQELKNCRLFALPSTREGFGLVYLEAMAHGRPCLGARAAAVPEIITPATGVLTEPDSIDSVAKGMIQGLRTSWNQALILDQARNFSYERFKARLSEQLQASPAI
jgi:glycosyltransferase involved in cell wall biosynthesis